MKKKCFKCGKIKLLEFFYKHPDMPDGHVNKCKICNRLENKNHRNKNKIIINDKRLSEYRNNKLNTIYRIRYSGMVTRVNGSSKRTYCVQGKELCSYTDFLDWCSTNEKVFKILHKDWVKSNFKRKLAPSIDRIDNNKGYLINNMRWITQVENSIKGNK